MMWKTASRSHRYCNGKSSLQTPINQGQYQQENVFEFDELRICYNCKDTTPIVGKYSNLIMYAKATTVEHRAKL